MGGAGKSWNGSGRFEGEGGGGGRHLQHARMERVEKQVPSPPRGLLVIASKTITVQCFHR